MKLFDKKIGNQIVNFNGRKVQFINSVAEVEDDFGSELLKMGFPDLYEFGKQPVYETPKEIQMKTDFSEKEEWYKGECSRLRNIADSRKKQVEDLEAEVKLWKAEYEKERMARLTLVESMSDNGDPIPQVSAEQSPVAPENGENEGGSETVEDELEAQDGEKSVEASDDELRQELSAMKKDELIAFAKSNGFTEIDDFANRKKSEIIEYIVESTK